MTDEQLEAETVVVDVCPADYMLQERRGDHGALRLSLVLTRSQALELHRVLDGVLTVRPPRPKLFDSDHEVQALREIQ